MPGSSIINGVLNILQVFFPSTILPSVRATDGAGDTSRAHCCLLWVESMLAQGFPPALPDTVQANIKAREFFGISDDVERGYKGIRVNVKVKSPADPETLTKLAMCSPVYEMVSKAVPVDFTLTTK